MSPAHNDVQANEKHSSYAQFDGSQQHHETQDDPALSGPLILPPDPNGADEEGKGMLSEVGRRLEGLVGEGVGNRGDDGMSVPERKKG